MAVLVLLLQAAFVVSSLARTDKAHRRDAGSASTVATTAMNKPNILHILLDDFGWADAGWHRSPGYSDVQSPNMDSLVQEGVELDRHYVFQFCSPTRSAMQSGRNPIHVRYSQR